MIIRIHRKHVSGVLFTQRHFIFDNINRMFHKALFLYIVKDDWEAFTGKKEIPEIGSRETLQWHL